MSSIKLPRAVSDLVTSFEKLPGVGPKSAQRLVFYLLHNPDHELESFAQNLLKLKKNTILCKICHNVSESNPCPVCADATRSDALLCVVEQPLDVLAIERSGAYNGRYHVLHGVIAPLSNIGPEQLYLHDIAGRLDAVEEIVLATNPTMEGEATALYITEYLQQQGKAGGTSGVVVSRIGHGLPIGADIEYADGMTLSRALEGRRTL